MVNKKARINIISLPYSSKLINESEIMSLKNLLNNFKFDVKDNYYNFIYGNLEIILTNMGAVSISLISTVDSSKNQTLLSNLLSKINSIISIDYSSIKKTISDLNIDKEYERD